jgi:hypothetical protein
MAPVPAVWKRMLLDANIARAGDENACNGHAHGSGGGTLPDSCGPARVVYNPMRVIADDSGCEVVFTLRRPPGMSDEGFKADAAAVAADLTRLKHVLERRRPLRPEHATYSELAVAPQSS